MADKGNRKGAIGEESMRLAFRKMGYFVVRDVPYSFREFAVTDIDLWLYGKAGAFRERINVDIKNKKTPQAIERILWTLGVMHVLKLDKCIVVTTETNPAVTEFGKRCGVTVVDGRFLSESLSFADDDRLIEEDFYSAISPPGAEEKGKELRRRYDNSKKKLLTHMNYDGCNLHLQEMRRCMTDLVAFPGMNEGVRRLLYAVVSHFMITLDHLICRSEFSEAPARQKEVEVGLRFGSGGQTRMEEFMRLLTQCKSVGDDQVNNVIDGLVAQFRSGADLVKADIVAEFVMKQISPENLFLLARDFEQSAFLRICPKVADLRVELKSLILMFVDFHGLDRKAAIEW